jgi:DNA-directed RNA polymerase specialized sigma24 family protein
MPWVEPQLPHELADLPEQQRVVFMLIHGYQWTFGEVAEFFDVTKSTVQTHEGRAMKRLRDRQTHSVSASHSPNSLVRRTFTRHNWCDVGNVRQ